MTANPSLQPTCYGLRPPHAVELKRLAGLVVIANSLRTIKRMSNVLDFLLESFSPLHEEELYESVRVSSLSARKDVLYRYDQEVERGTFLPAPLRAGELRPFIPKVDGLANWVDGAGKLGLDPSSLLAADDLWDFVDAVKHHLLYCHAIVVDDPLVLVLGDAIRSMELERDGGTPENEDALLNYVQAVTHLGQLLRENILFLVDRHGLSPSLHQYDYGTVQQRLMELGRPYREKADIRELLARAPRDLQGKWNELLDSDPGQEAIFKDAHYDASAMRIATGLSSPLVSRGLASLHVPFKYDLALIEACHEALRRDHLREWSAGNSWLMTRVVDLNVPGISDLDPGEVSEIRRGPEFEKFREAIRNAITLAEALPQTLVDRDVEIQRHVRSILARARTDLEQSMEESPTLAAIRKGSVSMMAGGLAAIVTNALSPTETVTIPVILAALAGAAVPALVDAAQAATNVQGAQDANRSALAHYMCLA